MPSSKWCGWGSSGFGVLFWFVYLFKSCDVICRVVWVRPGVLLL